MLHERDCLYDLIIVHLKYIWLKPAEIMDNLVTFVVKSLKNLR